MDRINKKYLLIKAASTVGLKQRLKKYGNWFETAKPPRRNQTSFGMSYSGERASGSTIGKETTGNSG